MSDIQRRVTIKTKSMDEMQRTDIPRDGTGFRMDGEYRSKREEPGNDLTVKANKLIMTKGYFPLIELPAELRLKVCRRGGGDLGSNTDLFRYTLIF